MWNPHSPFPLLFSLPHALFFLFCLCLTLDCHFWSFVSGEITNCRLASSQKAAKMEKETHIDAHTSESFLFNVHICQSGLGLYQHYSCKAWIPLMSYYKFRFSQLRVHIHRNVYWIINKHKSLTGLRFSVTTPPTQFLYQPVRWRPQSAPRERSILSLTDRNLSVVNLVTNFSLLWKFSSSCAFYI